MILIFLLLTISISGQDFQTDKLKRDVFVSGKDDSFRRFLIKLLCYIYIGDAGDGYRYVHDIPDPVVVSVPKRKILHPRPKFTQAQVVSEGRRHFVDFIIF